jgi:hypothetical protein
MMMMMSNEEGLVALSVFARTDASHGASSGGRLVGARWRRRPGLGLGSVGVGIGTGTGTGTNVVIRASR